MKLPAIIFLGLLFLMLPMILLIVNQSGEPRQQIALANVSCPTLPNESPEPQNSAIAINAVGDIEQLDPQITKDQQKVTISIQEVQQLTDKFTRRKQQMRKLMRHNPEKALGIMQSAITKKHRVKLSQCVETPSQLEGDLAAYAIEYTNGTSGIEFILQTSWKPVQVHVAKAMNKRLRSGLRVRVSGFQLDSAMLIDGSTADGIQILSDFSQTAAAVTTKKAAIQLGNFTTTNVSTPTMSKVQTETFPAVSSYFEQISQGKFSFEGIVFNWKNTGIAPTCDITVGVNAGLQAAATQLDWTNTGYFLLAAPFQGCAWEGISTIGQQRIVTPQGITNMGVGLVKINNGTLPAGVTAHEFGHQLGWYHAGFADCADRVLSGTCSVIVYGDMYDIMGNANYMGNPNAYHLDMLNWLDNSSLQTVTASGTFSILPLSSTQTGIKVLKIPQSDPNNTFYIEYRQPTGIDTNLQQISGTNVFEGVLIHRRFSDLSNNAPDTILIDPSPPSDAKTAALLPNASVTLPGTNITITNLGKSGTVTNVQVTLSGSTPAPTVQPTGTGTGTRINLTVFLHGIGNGGDNVTPQSQGTQNPIHPQRTFTVEIYNASNLLVLTKQAPLTFNAASGNFQGIVELGNLASDVYLVKIGMNQFLKKVMPGIQQITAGVVTTLPVITLVNGDINNDNALSVADYNLLIDCFSDLTQPRNCTDQSKKQAADITDDGGVNQFDYNLFLREMSVQSGN